MAIVVLFVAVYVITLLINYMIVRFFSKMAAWFMYGTGIFQIIMFGLIFYYLGTFEASKLPRGYVVVSNPDCPSGCNNGSWHKKFALAIEYTKMSCLLYGKKENYSFHNLYKRFGIFLAILPIYCDSKHFFEIGNFVEGYNHFWNRNCCDH